MYTGSEASTTDRYASAVEPEEIVPLYSSIQSPGVNGSGVELAVMLVFGEERSVILLFCKYASTLIGSGAFFACTKIGARVWRKVVSIDMRSANENHYIPRESVFPIQECFRSPGVLTDES